MPIPFHQLVIARRNQHIATEEQAVERIRLEAQRVRQEAKKAVDRLQALAASNNGVLPVTPESRALMQRVEYALQDTLRVHYSQNAVKYLESNMKKFMSDGFKDALSGLQATGVENLRATFSQGFDIAYESFVRRPVLGLRPDQSFDGLSKKLQRQVQDDLLAGAARGESIPDIAKRIDKHLELGEVSSTRIARTNLIAAYNEGHMGAYKENEDIIGGYKWEATFDSRTSQICMSLHGKVFALDEEPPGPPAHPNCRSILVPVFKDPELNQLADESGKRVGDTKGNSPDGKSHREVIDATTPYDSWLRTQPEAVQRTAMGTQAKYELFKGKYLRADQFMTPEFRGMNDTQAFQAAWTRGDSKTWAALQKMAKKYPHVDPDQALTVTEILDLPDATIVPPPPPTTPPPSPAPGTPQASPTPKPKTQTEIADEAMSKLSIQELEWHMKGAATAEGIQMQAAIANHLKVSPSVLRSSIKKQLALKKGTATKSLNTGAPAPPSAKPPPSPAAKTIAPSGPTTAPPKPKPKLAAPKPKKVSASDLKAFDDSIGQYVPGWYNPAKADLKISTTTPEKFLKWHQGKAVYKAKLKEYKKLRAQGLSHVEAFDKAKFIQVTVGPNDMPAWVSKQYANASAKAAKKAAQSLPLPPPPPSVSSSPSGAYPPVRKSAADGPDAMSRLGALPEASSRLASELSEVRTQDSFAAMRNFRATIAKRLRRIPEKLRDGIYAFTGGSYENIRVANAAGSPQERAALFHWKSNANTPNRVAQIDRQWGETSRDIDGFFRVAETIYTNETSPLYRGVSNLPPEIIDDMIQSGRVELETITSTSRSPHVADGFASGYEHGTRDLSIVIRRSKSGVPIEPISQIADEYEIVFRRGTKFRILRAQKKGARRIVLEVEEI